MNKDVFHTPRKAGSQTIEKSYDRGIFRRPIINPAFWNDVQGLDGHMIQPNSLISTVHIVQKYKCTTSQFLAHLPKDNFIFLITPRYIALEAM